MATWSHTFTTLRLHMESVCAFRTFRADSPLAFAKVGIPLIVSRLALALEEEQCRIKTERFTLPIMATFKYSWPLCDNTCDAFLRDQTPLVEEARRIGHGDGVAGEKKFSGLAPWARLA